MEGAEGVEEHRRREEGQEGKKRKEKAGMGRWGGGDWEESSQRF